MDFAGQQGGRPRRDGAAAVCDATEAAAASTAEACEAAANNIGEHGCILGSCSGLLLRTASIALVWFLVAIQSRQSRNRSDRADGGLTEPWTV
uniref:Uncharacterized protein n=1 Tax=Oryza sativa subsp. japonica TaxID=39947 RepID=Q650Z8_ORYSJ|nr:hypothetical protein [Oryza sativa Japonica Group]BAD54676.1 hypothetical protein [Oryza sativa Japonica Group]